VQILPPTQLNDLRAILGLTPQQICAIDLETTGLSPFAPDSRILTIGLASPYAVVALDTRAFTIDDFKTLFTQLRGIPLIAHNLLFDSTWLDYYAQKYAFVKLSYAACTYVMYKLCSTEGWDGQSWSLDHANENVLNTAVNNKDNLTQLLSKHKLPKSAMSQLADLEPESFMLYCANDAEACYELYHDLIKAYDSITGEGSLLDHASLWFNEIALLREQKLRGITIDRAGVEAYREKLLTEINKYVNTFYQSPYVQEIIAERKEKAYAELLAKQPKKIDLIHNHMSKQPPNRTKDGSLSKRWVAWHLKLQDLQNSGQRYNAAWIAWDERRQALSSLPAEHWFNLNSIPDLKHLFYDVLKFTALKTTESGEPSLDNKALRFLGDLGKLLVSYRDLTKEESYVRSCLENLSTEDILRPGFKVFGTITGRIAGGGD
jgi:DNA polymerase I-like protein with 3'-5' exonuclease and polymerase domains